MLLLQSRVHFMINKLKSYIKSETPQPTTIQEGQKYEINQPHNGGTNFLFIF